MSDRPKRIVDLCPSPHLEAADLAGEDVVVTIKSFDWHPVGVEEVIKGVIYFEEFNRGMVINRTNVKALQKLFGENLELVNIVGKRITLYTGEATYQGKIVPALRIRSKHPAAAKEKAEQREAVEA